MLFFLKHVSAFDTNDIVNGDNAQANSWVVYGNPFFDVSFVLPCGPMGKYVTSFLKDSQQSHSISIREEGNDYGYHKGTLY